MSLRAATCPTAGASRGRTLARAIALACLLTLMVASPSAAQLARVDVGQLTLIYFDLTESYLVPHAVQ